MGWKNWHTKQYVPVIFISLNFKEYYLQYQQKMFSWMRCSIDSRVAGTPDWEEAPGIVSPVRTCISSG